MAAAGDAITAIWTRWLTNRLALSGQRVRLHYRRIFILPSRAGLVFTLMLAGIWLGAVNYSSNLAFLLCFLLVGLGISAKFHTFRNLLGLQVEMDNAPAVFAGGRAAFPVRLINPDRRERIAVEILHPGDDAQALDVPPGGEASARLMVPAPERGRLQPGAFRVQTRFPTGLVGAWSWLTLDASVIVYPKPEVHGTRPPPMAGGRRGGRQVSDGDDDFHSLRRYQPGDSLRQVAWHTVARGQELQTKQFAGVTSGELWLNWNHTAGMPVERRISRLCRWVLDAEAAGQRYGLVLPGQRIQPDHGQSHRDGCLTALALFQP